MNSGKPLQILQTELKNLFQLNNKDLDFGIYKIYGVLNEKLNNWIDNTLPKKVNKTLKNIHGENLEELEIELKNKIEEINSILENLGQKLEENLLNIDEIYNSLCSKNADSKICKNLKIIKQLNQKIKQSKQDTDLENVVYNYILEFYSSIYQDGDYIIPRKKIIGNDINDNDVEFDWKTKGQILIKNMDVQTYFSFETKSGEKIEFKVVDIVDYGDNNKNKSRFLIPVNFILEKDNLVVEFVLGKFDETTLNNNIQEKKVSDLIEELVKKIDNTNLSFDGKNIYYGKYSFGEKENALLGKEDKIGVLHLIKLFLDKKDKDSLKQELFNLNDNGITNEKQKLLDFKDNNGNNCLLAKNLRKWYRMGTSDFFLNPNLKEELEEYKNEFIKNKMFHYLLEATKGDTNKANVLRAFEEIVNEINSFVSTIEQIQVELFNRKKYIYETHYVITFDRLKIFSLEEDLSDLKEFLKNLIGYNFKDLQEEYFELGMIKEEDKKEKLEDFIDFVLENNKLYIDTKLLVNKEGNEFFEVYGKTFDLLVFVSKFIEWVNKNKGENNLVDNKLEQLNITLEQGEKLDLDKLLNGELYKGDNYHALNLLQNKYYEQIKTIYIDPPYNTGNDGFLYKDNMKHSTWLTMMESRLKLARELMREDSVIFSSIDDNEVDNLKKLESMIFRDENFIGNIIWRKRAGGGNDSKHLAVEHESILFFGKTIHINTFGVRREKVSHYKKDNKGYYLIKPLNDTSLQDSPGLHYNIQLDDGKILKGNNYQWKMTKDKFLKKLKNNEIIFNNEKVYYKHYVDINKNIIPSSIFYNLALNSDGTKNIKSYFGKKLFSNPKPYKLIIKLFEISSQKNDFILDFFPGSGTTADAVIRLNQEDGGNRKFILTEINDYFDTIIIPRVKKIAFLTEWKDGKPNPENKNAKQPGIFFKYSYIENYEDSLENFVLKLEETLHNEEIQKNDLENNLYNLALAVGMAFEESDIKISFNNFQLKNEKTYPSYKLANKRNDIFTFTEEKYGKKALKTFVDLVHYYPLVSEGKNSLKSVKKENGEFVFEYSDEKGETETKKLKDIDLNDN